MRINGQNKTGKLFLIRAKRWQAPLERFVFPLILLLWPLAAANQGVSLMDTTYSLANYTYPDSIGHMWFFATFGANAVGHALVSLPFGKTLLSMNLLTGLIVSVTALCAYYILSRMIAGWMVFLGEFAAIALCWCPAVILYNYLTYLLLTLAVLFLFLAVSGVPEKKRWYVLAGVCLGLNVSVKISNVEYCALILALWFWCAITHKKFGGYLRRTFFCVLGFLLGLAVPVGWCMAAYGPDTYLSMIPELLGATGAVSSYTPAGMLTSILSAYGHSLRWFLILVPCTIVGAVWFSMPLFSRRPLVKRLVYLAGMLLVIRFFYSRGMFTTNYQDYWSMFEWGMFLLILCWIGVFFAMAEPSFLESGGGSDERFLGAAVLIELLVLPLGSNNYTFPILNCLFIIAPFTIWMLRRLWQETRNSRPHHAWHAMAMMILCMVFLQGSLFHVEFAFRDGTDGTKRTAVLSPDDNAVAAGMHTTPDNAEEITALTAFLESPEADVQRADGTRRTAIVFGNVPGVHYLCSLPPAVDTTWVDLDSYAAASFAKALQDPALSEERPLVILHDEPAAQSASSGEKEILLRSFLDEQDYHSVWQNGSYEVYE